MFKLAAAVLFLTAASLSSAESVGEAMAAYSENRVAEAERIFAAVAADSGADAEDRADSYRELGRIAWHIDGDAQRALSHLRAARATGSKLCETGAVEARVLRESGLLDRLLARREGLLTSCDDSVKRDAIRLQLARARLDGGAADAAGRDVHLAAAEAELGALGPDAAGSLTASAARLELGLMSGDAVTALKGWKDYFWLTDTDGPPSLRSFDATALFRRGLDAGATDDGRVELAHLLMRAGFAQPLRRFAALHGLPGDSASGKWRLVATYLAEREKLEEVELRVNRALARGGSKDDPALQEAAMAALGALMAAAGASGNPKVAILEHYGLLGSVGKTSGYPSLHIGHVVEDRRETVTQFGRSAEIRFTAVDNMWANGFETWLWDGRSAAGGWAGDGTIVHVRPAYTHGPVRAFALVGDTRARRELLERLPAKEAEDLAQARAGRVTTLNGLSDRLRLQHVDQIAAAVRAKSAGGDFRSAFLDEYWRANLQQSIFVHEGRHAIDQAMAGEAEVDAETLEYQAKLSELALSDYPRMALWNMNRGIGGPTPHDRAATRVFVSLARWIEQNSAAVAGYDPALPATVQIDKLSDEQIRQIARSLDPLAREKPTALVCSPSGTSR